MCDFNTQDKHDEHMYLKVSLNIIRELPLSKRFIGMNLGKMSIEKLSYHENQH